MSSLPVDAIHLGASFDGPASHKLLNDKKSALRLAWPNAAEAREYARHTARIVRRSKVNFTLGGAILSEWFGAI